MEPAHNKARFGGWLFLLLVVAIYGVVAVFDAQAASQALGHFGKVMRRILPILVMVFVLLLALDLSIKPAWIRRNLGQESGIRAWLLTLIGGVLATGPIYPWYALLRELRSNGMRSSLAAVFLYSRAIKLPLLPFMIHYFGMAYTAVLCLYLLVFAVVSGMLMLRLEDRTVS